MCMFCRSLFVLLFLFVWPLCCLSFFELDSRYEISTSQMAMDLFVFRYIFFLPITDKTFTRLNNMSNTVCVSIIRNRNYLLFVSTCVHPWVLFFVRSVLFIFLIFCVVFLFCFVCLHSVFCATRLSILDCAF
jgi:hypothetical protein